MTAGASGMPFAKVASAFDGGLRHSVPYALSKEMLAGLKVDLTPSQV